MSHNTLLHQTFTNILKTQQQQHNFTEQQSSNIVQTIVSTDRTTQTIEQQLQSIIKLLQQKTSGQSSNTKLFRPYELEWVMNWLIQVYYKHLQLIKAYEDEVENDRKRSEKQGKKIGNKLQEKDSQEIQLLVDTPVFVEPLTKAKLIREGAQPIMID